MTDRDLLVRALPFLKDLCDDWTCSSLPQDQAQVERLAYVVHDITNVLRSAPDTEPAMCDEYQAWCDARGLPKCSADELVYTAQYETLSLVDRKWITTFILRWDAMIERQRRARK